MFLICFFLMHARKATVIRPFSDNQYTCFFLSHNCGSNSGQVSHRTAKQSDAESGNPIKATIIGRQGQSNVAHFIECQKDLQNQVKNK